MEWNQLLNLLLGGGMLLLGGLALWYKGSAAAGGMATSLIIEAENLYRDTAKSGGKKFEWVVDQLYGWVPAPLRLVLPRAAISALVQTVFDTVEAYAKLQLDRAVEKAGRIDDE